MLGSRTLMHAAAGATAVVCALAVVACGSQQKARTSTAKSTKAPKHDIHTIYVYSSLPLSGPQAAESRQIEDGVELAFAGKNTHVGAYKIKYQHLPDSAKHGSGWNATVTVRNAEEAARNPQTIAYIGELNSGATELSLPILNQAGIVEITPGSGYPGLTNQVKGVTQQNEPGKYYPQGDRTLLRLIPSDLVQAAAALDLLKQSGCQHLGVWQFGSNATSDATATSLADAIKATAARYGISLVSTPPLTSSSKTYDYSYLVKLHSSGLNCAVLVGHAGTAAATFTTELHYQLAAGAKIVGTNGLCNRGWTKPLKRAVVTAVESSLLCTTPLRPLSDYQGSQSFAAAFRSMYHRNPQAAGYLGYEAAELVRSAVSNLSTDLDNRRTLVDALTNGYAEDTAGNTFDPNGNVSSLAYGVDKIVGGVPTRDGSGTITPPQVLGQSSSSAAVRGIGHP